jgi:hypothetical protein
MEKRWAEQVSNRRATVGAVFLFLLHMAFCQFAQCASYDFALTRTFDNPRPETSNGSDRFASRLVDAGGGIAIGSPLEDTGALDAGAAYIFEETTGILLRTILNPFPDLQDQFGLSLAWLGDNRIAIGAPLNDETEFDTGTVYVFDMTTGNLLKTLESPQSTPSGLFGSWVDSMEGNLLIGAPGDLGVGAAYLMDPLTGAVLKTFSNPTPEEGDRFGIRVAFFDSGRVIISDDFDNAGATHAGSVFLLDSTTGGLLKSFHNPFPSEGDRMGIYIAAEGENVLAGAITDDADGTDAGIAYLFDASDEMLLRTFHSPSPRSGGFFGVVETFNGLPLIGEPAINPELPGKAFLFDPQSGELLKAFQSPNPPNADNFGHRLVQIGFDGILIGAFSDLGTGAAYLYRLVIPPPTPTPTASPTPTPGCESGLYMLVGSGQILRVGNPHIITGDVSLGGDLAKDLERVVAMTESGPQEDLAILDGAGVATWVENPGASIPQDFLLPVDAAFPRGRAVDLEMSRTSEGFWVLADFGGIYRAGDAKEPSDPPLLPGTDKTGILGYDIPFGAMRNPSVANPGGASLRAVALVVIDAASPPNRADGYIVFDSQGGHYPIGPDGMPVTPGTYANLANRDPLRLLEPGPAGYEYPFFPGFDIARDAELFDLTQEGLVVFDGWGGIHPVPEDDPANAVFFARNEDPAHPGHLISTLGMPYLVAGFDDPRTPENEADPATHGIDAYSIFVDFDFSAGCPDGFYTLDKFGGVYVFGSARPVADDLVPAWPLPFISTQNAVDLELFAYTEAHSDESDLPFRRP